MKCAMLGGAALSGERQAVFGGSLENTSPPHQVRVQVTSRLRVPDLLSQSVGKAEMGRQETVAGFPWHSFRFRASGQTWGTAAPVLPRTAPPGLWFPG